MATTNADSTIVVVVELQATDQAARDQLISLFEKIIAYSKDKEPGVLKYGICTPADNPKDVTTLYAIEEYADQKSYDDHMSIAPVKDILASLVSTSETPSLIAKPPTIYSLHWTKAVFTRKAELLANPNPYILWATIDTHSIADTEKIEPYGTAVVEFARDNEPDTLFYGDARANSKRDDNRGFIAAVEIYTDLAALEHHFQGKALQAMVGECKTLGGALTTVGLKRIAGWLIRE